MSKLLQAFPHHFVNDVAGMTLRDYFAAQALQAIVNGDKHRIGMLSYEALVESAAKVSYDIADAMLRERAK